VPWAGCPARLLCSGVIADLPRRHEEADRTAIGVRDSMKLCVHAAFRAPDQPAKAPFFTTRYSQNRLLISLNDDNSSVLSTFSSSV
jgi:hypothetical protein